MPEVTAQLPRGEIRLSATTNPDDVWHDYVNIHCAIRERDYTDDHSRAVWVAKPAVFERIEERDAFTAPAPLLSICRSAPDGHAALTRLMDQLWAIGIRPSDIGTPGHLAATQAHLADMRAIVAAKLEVPLKT